MIVQFPLACLYSQHISDKMGANSVSSMSACISTCELFRRYIFTSCPNTVFLFVMSWNFCVRVTFYPLTGPRSRRPRRGASRSMSLACARNRSLCRRRLLRRRCLRLSKCQCPSPPPLPLPLLSPPLHLPLLPPLPRPLPLVSTVPRQCMTLAVCKLTLPQLHRVRLC